MIGNSNLIRESIIRAQHTNFHPAKLSAKLDERDRGSRVSTEQKRARLAELVVETGDMPAARRTLERLLGGNDLVSINYLGRGMSAAMAVCRIHLRNENHDSLGFGTGFLVAPGVVMTNHHVLSREAEVRHALAEFNYELDTHGKTKPTVEFALTTDPKPIAVEDLDFCLAAVASRSADRKHSLHDYGWLQLNPTPGKAIVGEYLTIIQHPGGERKQICVRENKLLKYDESGNTLWYQTDTVSGSSGSPVFNNSWQVVALHHSGVPKTDAKGRWLTVDDTPWDASMDESRVQWIANEGMRISRILDFLRTHEAGHPLAQAVLTTSPYQGHEGSRFPAGSTWATQGEDGRTRLMIPVEIAVSVGTPPGLEHPGFELPRTDAGPGLSATRGAAGVVTPVGLEKVEVDQTNYGKRPGYDPAFLGSGGLTVPLPALEGNAASRALRKSSNSKKPLVLKYWNYSVVMHKVRNLAIFAAANVDANLRPNGAGRDGDRWYSDTRIDESRQLDAKFYGEQKTFEVDRSRNPFDRGHLVRRLDAQWGADEDIAKRNGDDSFHWTNCSPQHFRFNQGARRWLGLEDFVIKSFAAPSGRACVFNGPVFDAPLSGEAEDGRIVPRIDGKSHKDPTFGGVQIPKLFFKVVVARRSTGALAAAAFLMSQEDFLRTVGRLKGLPALPQEAMSRAEARLFQVRVRDIEKLTRLDFRSLSDADTSVLEGVGGQLPRIVTSEADIRL